MVRACFAVALQHIAKLNFRMTDLETALLEECSATDIYCICKGKPLPESVRAEVWQVGGVCVYLCFSMSAKRCLIHEVCKNNVFYPNKC